MRAKHHARSGFRKVAGATLVLAFGAAVLAAGPARADGEDYGAPGPYGGQPQYLDEDQQGQPQAQPQETYQPPPENLCYDEDNQPRDCSSDTDFASYNQIDDGYDPQAYQDFEQTLSPYGSWVDAPSYGRVWVPSQAIVGADFTPYYSGGRWSYTDYGWTWASDYDWGWAPFHYGRWTNVAGYGWSWIPGRIWGPAWVHWRHGGGYVGWAPLPPRGFRIPAPIGARAAAWSFVPTNMMGGNRLVRVDPYQVPRFYHQTMGGSVIRSVGQTRVIVGPPPAAQR